MWNCMGRDPGDIRDVSEAQCRDCREVFRIPPGFWTSWDEMDAKFPEHECKGPYHLTHPSSAGTDLGVP